MNLRNTKPGKPVTIIACHVNADFDALASVLCAQKLYPDALVVFPGSQEKNLRLFLIQSVVYLLNLVEQKQIDLSSITRLVLIDTSQRDRIGSLSRILDNPDLEIHSYDHHPEKESDIRVDKDYRRLTGATATILTDLLKEKEIDISPQEATIVCLGIYEATGSFSFSSTTEHDLMAAAYLLSKGANLNMISTMITREFSPGQVGLLNDMLQSSRRYMINGVEILLTNVATDNFIPDFSFLVRKMAKMENSDVIFALGLMGNEVHVVARSRINDADAGDILGRLGGSGSHRTAEATLKGKTLAQTEQLLLDVLNITINPRRKARHLMSSPAIMGTWQTTCQDARGLLTRYNINALLVGPENTEDGGASGYITRQVIEKALFHNLGEIPIHEYMSSEISSVDPDADIEEIQNKIMGYKQRILPVVQNGEVLGVITRTDLLNVLVQQHRSPEGDTSLPAGEMNVSRSQTVLRLMREHLTESIMTILVKVGEAAGELGVSAYVVGGFVRDLFLGRKNEDIDIVIEGDGIAFAEVFAKQFGGRVHTHVEFGTAVIVHSTGLKIDVASARTEYYQFPASLPVVEMSSIKMDMFRRDFTINTLAIELNPDKFGRLLDFFSGRKDIRDNVLRVLHNLSFVEDPTRIFRVLRFEQRFGFTIGKLTASLIDNAISMNFFRHLSGRRVYTELKLILKEKNPAPAILRLQDYDLFKVIHPKIKIEKDLVHLLDTAKKVTDWHELLFVDESYKRWAVFFMTLIGHCDLKASNEICEHLCVVPRNIKLFGELRLQAEKRLQHLEVEGPIKQAEIYRLLQGFKTELILYMMIRASSQTAQKRISLFHTKLRNVSTGIRGKDLIDLGLKPGPLFSEIMDSLKTLKLNGLVKTHEDELRFVKEHFVK